MSKNKVIKNNKNDPNDKTDKNDPNDKTDPVNITDPNDPNKISIINNMNNPNNPILKLKLNKVLENKAVNHIYFYEKRLDFNSLKTLREKINTYTYTSTGQTVHDNLLVNSRVNPLLIHIHCPGGDIDAGISAMQLIHNCVIPVITIVDGLAASSATYMCMASSYRVINPNGHMLIHQLSQQRTFKGKYLSIEDRYIRIKKYMRTLRNIYEQYTKLTKEQIKTILNKDLYLDANTCLKYGLVDKIME